MKLLKEVLESFPDGDSFEVDLDDGDLALDVVVLIRYKSMDHNDGTEGMLLAHSGTGAIVQVGMLHAALARADREGWHER